MSSHAPHSSQGETENLRDHEFDGIREYDNPMPSWWTRSFWATFFFAIAYIFYFESAKGRGIIDEYDADMQAYYEKETAALLALGTVDENMLATLTKNKAAMNEAQAQFTKTCSVCHKADGGGDIGPNLTDDHWIGSNTLLDIYNTVDKGRAKMPAWGKKLGPALVMKMSAYVGTLRYTFVANGKAPEGKKLAPAPLPDGKTPAAASPAAPSGTAPAPTQVIAPDAAPAAAPVK